MEATAQHARQIANSTKALRDVLTPEQRNRFDQMSLRHGQGNAFRQNDRRGNTSMEQTQPAAAKPAHIRR